MLQTREAAKKHVCSLFLAYLFYAVIAVASFDRVAGVAEARTYPQYLNLH